MTNSSIWPLDNTLSDTTTPGRSGPGSNGNEEYSTLSKALALLELHYQIVSCHLQDICWGIPTPLQRCSRCILQPQPTGPNIFNENPVEKFSSL